MLVSKSWCEEVAKDIIWEFENLLCNNDIKIDNTKPEENKFESADSYINKKDYEIKKNNEAVIRVSRLCGRRNRRCCIKWKEKKEYGYTKFS